MTQQDIVVEPVAIDKMTILEIPEEFEMTPENLLNHFGGKWKELTSKKYASDEIDSLISAKNEILQDIVSGQMKEQRYFEIISPFDHTCSNCKGAGELYKFKRKTVEVKCHICHGDKEIEIQCPTCKGSGRYEREFSGGGIRINVVCKTCAGEKKIKVKCGSCRGEGKIRKPVLSHELESTTPCESCGQLGFSVDAPKKKRKSVAPMNPVLSESLAKKIQETEVSPTD